MFYGRNKPIARVAIGFFCSRYLLSKSCFPGIIGNIQKQIAGSSNGRTSPSEGEYLGSNPGPAAMTKQKALELLEIYGRAWVTKNPDLIVTIFTDNAAYNDPHEPENIGREAIRAYWQNKVVGEQDNITFDLKNIWLEDKTVIAEWHASFRDIKRNLQVTLKEVAIFETSGNLFSSLREYYQSTKTPL